MASLRDCSSSSKKLFSVAVNLQTVWDGPRNDWTGFFRGAELLRFFLLEGQHRVESMAFPHPKKSERTSESSVWLSCLEETKGAKKKCIFKDHQADDNCTNTDCPLYPKLSCRKFTYTTNADRKVPRCEHMLNRTRGCPSSDLRCNPFQIPLKEIVAQEIRSCAEERCSNYSLRYIYNNFCECDMNTLRGLLPSFQGYNNICCKRKNYNREVSEAEGLKMLQMQMAAATDKIKHLIKSELEGIDASSVHHKCKSHASKKGRSSKGASQAAETNYPFQDQLMEKAKRKSEENKDLSNVKGEEFENAKLRTGLDTSSIRGPPRDNVPDPDEETTESKSLNTDVETMFEPSVVASITPIITMPSEGLTPNTETDPMAENNVGEELHVDENNISEELNVVADETKDAAVIGNADSETEEKVNKETTEIETEETDSKKTTETEAERVESGNEIQE